MYDLERFVKAQNHNYQDALEEIRNGRKKSCWMWYVFPQISGLGRSAMAKKYELQSLAEAKAYLDHPILSTRLQEICEAALVVDCSDAGIVFGSPDDLKLRSSMTLFEQAAPENPVFGMMLDKFFGRERDELTLPILET